MLRDVREAVPYIFPLDCIVNYQLSIVNCQFPQLFTFHFFFLPPRPGGGLLF